MEAVKRGMILNAVAHRPLLMRDRNMRRRRQGKRHCRSRLRKTLGDEAARYEDHTFQNRSHRYTCLPRLCWTERRCAHPGGQSSIGGPVTSSHRRRSRDHRIHHKIRCWCPATIHTKRWCPAFWYQHAHRWLRQGRQDPTPLPNRTIWHLLRMVRQHTPRAISPHTDALTGKQMLSDDRARRFGSSWNGITKRI